MLLMANEFQCSHCNKKPYKTEKNLINHVDAKHSNTKKDILPISEDQKKDQNKKALMFHNQFLDDPIEDVTLYSNLINRKKVIGAKCHNCNIALNVKHIFGEPVILDEINRVFRVEFQCPGDSYIMTRIQKES